MGSTPHVSTNFDGALAETMIQTRQSPSTPRAAQALSMVLCARQSPWQRPRDKKLMDYCTNVVSGVGRAI
eukprot:m.267844 g.267844  ORF g.267844 m.267844 type:complete len:70 (-) comp75067_c0_seq1:70-279(-)